MSKLMFHKILLFAVFGAMFASCEKDLYTDNMRQTDLSDVKVRRISYTDIKNDAAAMRKLIDIKASTINVPLAARGVYNEQFGIYLDTTKIMELLKDGVHSLTFKIEDDSIPFILKNLVMVQQGTEAYKAFITEYELTEQEFDKLAHGVPIGEDKMKRIKDMQTNQKFNVGPCITNFYYIVHGHDAGGNAQDYDVSYTVYDLDCIAGEGGTGYANGYSYSGNNSGDGSNSDSGGVGNYNGNNSPSTNPYSNGDNHGPVVPTTPTFSGEEPCSGLKSLIKKPINGLQPGRTVKNILTELQGAYGDGHETGYTLSSTDINEDAFTQTGPFYSDANGDLNIVFNGVLSIILHNHYSVAQLPVFSLSDIYSIYKSIGVINDTSTFTSILVTAHSTVYAIKIADKSAFISWSQNLFVGWDDPNIYVKKGAQNDSEKEYEKFVSEDLDKITNEHGLAKFLSQSGLKLYKGNDDFSEWKNVQSSNRIDANFVICN